MKAIVKSSPKDASQHQRIQSYYQFQSRIYDATRWAFLFGRTEILKQIPYTQNDAFRIVEIGCGTGFNLKYISQRFPNAELVGVDVSEDMIEIAKEKLSPFSHTKTFYQLPYDHKFDFLNPPPDIILFSYALTMINPQWKDLLYKAYTDLPKGGKIMVADFHNSNFTFFKNHMANHHVKMEGHLLPELKELFESKFESVQNAYGGMWQYFIYVGKKA